MMNLQSNKCDSSIKRIMTTTELPKIFLLQSHNQSAYLLQVRFHVIWLVGFHFIYTVLYSHQWLKSKRSVLQILTWQRKIFFISLFDADIHCSIFSVICYSLKYRNIKWLEMNCIHKTWSHSLILRSQNTKNVFHSIGNKFVHFMRFYYQKCAWRHLLYNWRLEIRFLSNLRTSREIIFEDVHAGCSLQPDHRTSSNSHSHFSIWTLRMATIWRWSFIHFIKTRMLQTKLFQRKSL